MLDGNFTEHIRAQIICPNVPYQVGFAKLDLAAEKDKADKIYIDSKSSD